MATPAPANPAVISQLISGIVAATGESLNALGARLEARLDALEARVEERLDALEARVEERFDALESTTAGHVGAGEECRASPRPAPSAEELMRGMQPVVNELGALREEQRAAQTETAAQLVELSERLYALWGAITAGTPAPAEKKTARGRAAADVAAADEADADGSPAKPPLPNNKMLFFFQNIEHDFEDWRARYLPPELVEMALSRLTGKIAEQGSPGWWKAVARAAWSDSKFPSLIDAVAKQSINAEFTAERDERSHKQRPKPLAADAE